MKNPSSGWKPECHVGGSVFTFVCELDPTSPCEGGGELQKQHLSLDVGFRVALGLVQSWDPR